MVVYITLAPNPNSIPDIFDESLSTRTVTRQVTRQVPKVIEVDRTRQVQVPRTRQVQVPRTRQVQVDRTRQVVTRINLEDYAQDGILDSNLWQPATLPDWIVRENNELVITPPATTVGTQTDITLTYDVYPITLTIFVR